jgi:carboxymethylenebutenolidase
LCNIEEGNTVTYENEQAAPNDPSRRDFVVLSAAGLAAAATVGASAASAAEAGVESRDVEIKTPDGTAEGAFFYQKGKSNPGVLLWADAFGLRPWTRQMGARLAASGYSVLVPNPFYRTGKGLIYPDVHSLSFAKEEDRKVIFGHMGALNAPGNPEKDAVAYIDWLDAQKEVDKKKKIGTQGYCMGGPLITKTAAIRPDRVGAAASFHGGGLVTDKPESPHLLIAKIKAQLYYGVAANDDKQQPDAKDKLKEAIAAAHLKGEVELYPESVHGWCMKDMPDQADGKPTYNEKDAERAWAKLLALYKSALV